MDRSAQRDLQHIGLPTACAVIYAAVTGKTPNPLRPAEMDRVLNDVAHALSNLVQIYAGDPDSKLPKAVGPFDLLQGSFEHGAHVLKTSSGAELRALTIQRRDMLGAIAFFKSAHIRFG